MTDSSAVRRSTYAVLSQFTLYAKPTERCPDPTDQTDSDPRTICTSIENHTYVFYRFIIAKRFRHRRRFLLLLFFNSDCYCYSTLLLLLLSSESIVCCVVRN